MASPAAKMSAPKSGRIAIDIEPFCKEILMVSLGAGSDAATMLIFERSGSSCVESALVVAGIDLGSGSMGLQRHTLAKCPVCDNCYREDQMQGIMPGHLGVLCCHILGRLLDG